MQSTANWWWVGGATAAGLVFGTAASTITRRFVRRERSLAGAWWFGSVLTVAVLGLLGWRVGGRGELVVYGFAAVLAVPLAVIDWCEHRLPRALVWPQLAGALTGFAGLCLVRQDSEPGLRALAALAAAGGLFLLLALLTGGGVGAGDVNVAAVIGLITGWIGWAEVAGALLVAGALGAIVAAVPVIRRRGGKHNTVVPFGPCLFLGALAVVLA
ncbi:prepilin peptidase [Amycolatopsis sp. PS_44_ISF1]|uniref:prepilin peptidase n=1 Tax=Amycolatopsis sp. PS_44_ISF1 TaxID=2974917 RepID=UPI0028DF1C73|nr:prepilin peptidase [Amycolatopsis sp. PS_44_ISF1]MDT8916030.1 prepilin peptidase [Amycolatopsis sp. PS_44_ISF1]